MRCSVDWIASDADTSRLAAAARRELPNRLVSQCSRTGYNADVTLPVNVTGRDSDPATPMRIFTGTRRNDAGTIRPDQARPASAHRAFHTHHIHHRNAFRDADNQIELRI